MTRGHPDMNRHAWMDPLTRLVDQRGLPGNRRSVAKYLRGAALLQQEDLHTDLLYLAMDDLAEAKQLPHVFLAPADRRLRGSAARCDGLAAGSDVGSALPVCVLSIIAEGMHGSVPPLPEPEQDTAVG